MFTEFNFFLVNVSCTKHNSCESTNTLSRHYSEQLQSPFIRRSWPHHLTTLDFIIYIYIYITLMLYYESPFTRTHSTNSKISFLLNLTNSKIIRSRQKTTYFRDTARKNYIQTKISFLKVIIVLKIRSLKKRVFLRF